MQGGNTRTGSKHNGPPLLAFVREGGGGASTIETPQNHRGQDRNAVKIHLRLALVHEGGGGRILTCLAGQIGL